MALEKLWEVTLKRKDLTTRTIERLRTQVYEPAKANFMGESGLPREVPGQTYDEEAGEQFQREVATSKTRNGERASGPDRHGGDECVGNGTSGDAGGLGIL